MWNAKSNFYFKCQTVWIPCSEIDLIRVHIFFEFWTCMFEWAIKKNICSIPQSIHIAVLVFFGLSVLSILTKGQIIGKNNKYFLASSNFPKKRMNKFVVVVNTNSFVYFLGEFEDSESPFEII
jgi:hypothetical protein